MSLADPTLGGIAASSRSGTVVARRAARSTTRSGALWGYVFGAVVASSALSYDRFYRTAAERTRLAASFGSNHAASALFGPAPQLQTVAGFTEFKVSMTLFIAGAVWALLLATTTLRGEEESGRLELLLCGQTTPRRAAAQNLLALGAGAFVLWAVTAVIVVVTGRAPAVRIAIGPALFFALSLVSCALVFLAVGAATSQLAQTRRQASGLAAVLLGASYALRLIGDSGSGLHWLVWVSPLGWAEELQPLVAPRPVVLVPILGTTALLAAGSVWLAGQRDVGAAILPDRSTRPSHLALLAGPGGLAVRLSLPLVVAWSGGLAATGLVAGIVAKAAGSSLSGSSLNQVVSRLGARGGGTKAMLGVMFEIVALLLAFEAAAHISATRAEEASGRLDRLLAAPVGRTRWFAGRISVAAAALVIGGISAGLFAFVGAASEQSGFGFGEALDSGLNAVAPAVFVLGAGALALGIRPRRATACAYAIVAWSALVEFAGGMLSTSHWLLDLSIFHQMAAVPAVGVNWGAEAAMLGAGVVAAIVGDAVFCRRDLQPA